MKTIKQKVYTTVFNPAIQSDQTRVVEVDRDPYTWHDFAGGKVCIASLTPAGYLVVGFDGITAAITANGISAIDTQTDQCLYAGIKPGTIVLKCGSETISIPSSEAYGYENEDISLTFGDATFACDSDKRLTATLPITSTLTGLVSGTIKYPISFPGAEFTVRGSDKVDASMIDTFDNTQLIVYGRYKEVVTVASTSLRIYFKEEGHANAVFFKDGGYVFVRLIVPKNTLGENDVPPPLWWDVDRGCYSTIETIQYYKNLYRLDWSGVGTPENVYVDGHLVERTGNHFWVALSSAPQMITGVGGKSFQYRLTHHTPTAFVDSAVAKSTVTLASLNWGGTAAEIQAKIENIMAVDGTYADGTLSVDKDVLKITFTDQTTQKASITTASDIVALAHDGQYPKEITISAGIAPVSAELPGWMAVGDFGYLQMSNIREGEWSAGMGGPYTCPAIAFLWKDDPERSFACASICWCSCTCGWGSNQYCGACMTANHPVWGGVVWCRSGGEVTTSDCLGQPIPGMTLYADTAQAGLGEMDPRGVLCIYLSWFECDSCGYRCACHCTFCCLSSSVCPLCYRVEYCKIPLTPGSFGVSKKVGRAESGIPALISVLIDLCMCACCFPSSLYGGIGLAPIGTLLTGGSVSGTDFEQPFVMDKYAGLSMYCCNSRAMIRLMSGQATQMCLNYIGSTTWFTGAPIPESCLGTYIDKYGAPCPYLLNVDIPAGLVLRPACVTSCEMHMSTTAPYITLVETEYTIDALHLTCI